MTRTAVVLALGGLFMAAKTTDPALIAEGRLADCPASPNCVSSQAPETDEQHYIEPLAFEGDPATVIDRLRRAIVGMPRTQVLKATDRYLHAEFTSAIFRWVDDVELLVDADAGVVHVRSASRVGYGDLGANRKRVEALRAAFAAQ